MPEIETKKNGWFKQDFLQVMAFLQHPVLWMKFKEFSVFTSYLVEISKK